VEEVAHLPEWEVAQLDLSLERVWEEEAEVCQEVEKERKAALEGVMRVGLAEHWEVERGPMTHCTQG
jgi:hypothetical protein